MQKTRARRGSPAASNLGPEGAGKETVARLASDTGIRPIWVGGPDQASTIDGVLKLWAALVRTHGRRIAFKLITD
jgi:predicted dinucleotide-binding enzyme